MGYHTNTDICKDVLFLERSFGHSSHSDFANTLKAISVFKKKKNSFYPVNAPWLYAMFRCRMHLYTFFVTYREVKKRKQKD